MRKKRDNITAMRPTVTYKKVPRDDIESSDEENVPAKGPKVL